MIGVSHAPHDCLTAADRIAEIGEILALGLIRLRARKSSQFSDVNGESSLDCVATQSGHSDRNDRDRTDEG